jgi:hypothetical protein
MKSSEQPRIELEQAKTCVEEMRISKSLDEFEEYWKTLLHRLERVWNKTLNHYSKSPKWNGWKSKYDQLRKKDPLCYISLTQEELMNTRLMKLFHANQEVSE